MKGCRPLDSREYREALKSLDGKYATRDRAMFILGTRAGFRVSELLSIRVGDVRQNGRLVDRVTVARRNMKGMIEGRTVVLHPEAREAISDLLDEMEKEAGGHLTPDTFLFRSRNGENRPIRRARAWRILRRAFDQAKLTGKLGTHCMRKTFAQGVYEALNHDLVKTQHALGHKWITTTQGYISFAEEDIDRAILSI